jgi:DNA-binding CsgD family transcriptional regulator
VLDNFEQVSSVAPDRANLVDVALDCYRDGPAIAVTVGDRWTVVEPLAGLRGLAAAHGRPETAATLLGFIEALRTGSGVAPHPRHQAADAAAAATAHAAGRALALEKAVAAALSVEYCPAAATPSPPALADRISPGSVLTLRDADALRVLAVGRSNQAIADDLEISVLTVKTHVANLLAKIALDSRAAAATYAHRHGLI